MGLLMTLSVLHIHVTTLQVHIPVESEIEALCQTHGYNIPRGLMLKALQMFEALSDRDYAFTCVLCGYHPSVVITDVQRKACFKLKGEKVTKPKY